MKTEETSLRDLVLSRKILYEDSIVEEKIKVNLFSKNDLVVIKPVKRTEGSLTNLGFY